MFVAGKEYEWKGHNRRIKVLWVGKKVMTVEYTVIDPGDFINVGDELLWDLKDKDHWTEYHEPVIYEEVRYVKVDDMFSKQTYTSRHNKTYGGIKILGKVKFTVTDGKLTDVSIVE